MDSFSVNRRIRTPFLMISSGLVMVGTIGLLLFLRLQNSVDHLNETEIRVEKIYRSAFQAQRLVAGLQNERDQLNSDEFLADFDKQIMAFEEQLDQLMRDSEPVVFDSHFLSELFYHPEFSFLENFIHFGKLQRAINDQLKKKGRITKTQFFSEFEWQLTKIVDQAPPLLKSLRSKKEELQRSRNHTLIGIAVLCSVLTAMYFVFVYIPWKRDYQYLDQERKRLQGVLEESEVRGNTFSWEVNYSTELTKRSNHLSGMFEFEEGKAIVPLSEEVAKFSERGQKAFMEAYQQCVSSGIIMDIQVDMVTKNQKRYWLHYYAKRRDESGQSLISGTVRDITRQKFAEERFQVLFQHLNLPALIFGDGQIRSFNEAALNFFEVKDQMNYDQLHPAILFPLYQLDGHSSLEKLKEALASTKSGQVVKEDWLFQVSSGRETSGQVTLANIPYPEVDLHLLIIHQDNKKYEYERRLVDMNRKVLHAKRSKLEYITQTGIVLDEMIDIITEELGSIDSEYHSPQLDTIKMQLNHLWEENANEGLKEKSGSVLTDFNSFMLALTKRWGRKALSLSKEITVHVEEGIDQYLWLDSLKLKVILDELVQSALSFEDEETATGTKNVSVKISSTFQDTRNGVLTFFVSSNSPGWIENDWTLLNHIENRPVRGSETLLQKKSRQKKRSIELEKNQRSSDFVAIVELLQGEIFFEKTENYMGLGFSCSIERAIGESEESLLNAVSGGEGEIQKLSSADIWSHFGGDWDIIENTTRDFFEYYPTAIADMIYYLQEKDGEALEHIATEFYGVITHFPFPNAIKRVVRIQKYSRFLRFNKAEKEIQALNSELSLFHRELEEFLPDQKKSA